MPRQLIFELGPDAAPAFDNFLVGQNAELVAHLRALAADALAERAVVVWGTKGSGKSHLLAAVIAAAIGPAHVVRLDAPPTQVDAPALYAVDNVDRANESEQANLFTLFNACRDQGARLLMTAGAPPQQSRLRDDLRTRIGWGLVLELKPLADADKPAALAAYAEQHGFRLGNEVIAFLLSHVRRDMATLLSTLRALDRYSLSTKRPVTVPLVRDLLQPEFARESRDARDTPD